jgi:adenylate cyclase
MTPWRLSFLSRRVWIQATLLVLSMALLAAVFFPSALLRQVDDRITDYLWWWSVDDTRERRLVLVDIDEASLAALGAWPWPRARLAALAEALAGEGSRLQVLDILLDRPRPGDAALAAAARRLPMVFAEYLVIDPAVAAPPQSGRLAGALTRPGCVPPLPQARGWLGLSADLGPAVAGHITPGVDADGMVRRLPPLICHQGAAYPALSLAAYLRGLAAAPALELTRGRGPFAPAWWLHHPERPELRIPLDRAGQWLVPYRQARSAFISLSAHEVLTGAVPAGVLDGAWVLVGSTALGLGDRRVTPLARVAGGMEIHAQLITALLDGRLPYIPRGRLWLLLGLGLGLNLAFLALARQAKRALVLPIGLAAAVLGLLTLHAWLLIRHDVWLGPTPLIVQLALFVTLLFSAEFLHTLRERERLYANLRSYLPAGLAEDLARTLPTDRILGERTRVCVWVADIRNFAAWAEARPPEEAVALLHGFYRLAERVIRAEGGSIENYVGDAVQALWLPGAGQPSPAAAALRAARTLLREAGDLLERPAEPGLAPLALGIGIECGSALIGSIGPAARRSHTVLGETVTVAIRLQSMTQELAQPILLGPGARAELSEHDLLPLGAFLLEGLRRPRELYGCRPVAAASRERPARRSPVRRA